jgi:16S rRNA (cytosine967-C5)-methyltransferase
MLMRVEDGAFASRLLSGGGAPAARVRVLETLRWMRALDAVLEPLCRRKLEGLDPEVRAALRLGLVEAMRLGLPPALATDTAVRTVRRLGRSSASGMVNAVLRKATGGWREALTDSTIDVRLAHPEWLYRRWADHFGAERAESAMAAAQEPAVTWVWFFDESARSELVDDGVELRAHPWCPGAWSAPGETPRLIRSVRSGAAYAQDPSSQLAAHVARTIAGPGARLVDLCAAPGGKSALMVRLGAWGRVVASDLTLGRVRLMNRTLVKAGGCAVVAADATAPPFSNGAWDVVLLDAPCTGTGTLRRHPELKWRLRSESVSEMAELQQRLLGSGLGLLAPAGALLYATCSVEPEENEGVVSELPPAFRIENLEQALPAGVPWIPTTAGGIRILPHSDGDGFTMHAVRRR